MQRRLRQQQNVFSKEDAMNPDDITNVFYNDKLDTTV